MSAAKHYVEDPLQTVLASLNAVTKTNPSVLLDAANKTIYRHPSSIRQPTNVSVVCGGGSGHEPGFAGFVGDGLLTACVAGTIFASPSAEQVRMCLLHRIPRESQGILVIVTNYTGDILNFGMGVEKARAMGKMVEMVIVGDDVGVGRAKSGKVGRRGLSGTALVVKICGALAEMGVSLQESAQVGRAVVSNMVSLGASLGRVHVPGKSIEEAREEEQRLGHGQVEVGMGIHNEPGCEKIKTSLPGLIKIMLAQMLDQADKDRAYVPFDPAEETVLLLNNFGGVSPLELGAILDEATAQLGRMYQIRPKRIVQGTLFGSLNGQGFILTLLKMSDSGLGHGKSMLDALDAPVNATGWPRCVSAETWDARYSSALARANGAHQAGSTGATHDEEIEDSTLVLPPATLKAILSPALQKVISTEAEITKYDTVVGDGDCGVGMKRGAEALLSMLDGLSSDNLMASLSKICSTIETSMDGTSGALYAIFLNSLASNMRATAPAKPMPVTAETWARGAQMSLDDLRQYTPAQPGDRTLIDALVPFVQELHQSGGDVQRAAQAAQQGASKTKGMRPSLGRSVYVGGNAFENVPDPGAHGLSVFFSALAEAHASWSKQ